MRVVYNDNWLDLMEQLRLADITEDEKHSFRLQLEARGGEDMSLVVEGEPRTIYLINENGLGYSMSEVNVTGTMEIKVSEVPSPEHGSEAWKSTLPMVRARSGAETRS